MINHKFVQLHILHIDFNEYYKPGLQAILFYHDITSLNNPKHYLKLYTIKNPFETKSISHNRHEQNPITINYRRFFSLIMNTSTCVIVFVDIKKF